MDDTPSSKKSSNKALYESPKIIFIGKLNNVIRGASGESSDGGFESPVIIPNSGGWQGKAPD